MDIQKVVTTRPLSAIRKVFRILQLEDCSPEDLLLQYPHPALLRNACAPHDFLPGWGVCEDILISAGWERPPDYATDNTIPSQAKRRHAYGPDEYVYISKYGPHVARPGDYIERIYHGKVHRALVTPSGRLFAPDFDDSEALSPTAWARKVQGRLGNMSVMPRSFWSKATVVSSGGPRLDTLPTGACVQTPGLVCARKASKEGPPCNFPHGHTGTCEWEVHAPSRPPGPPDPPPQLASWLADDE